MGNPLNGVLNRMREIIQRVNTPLIALTVMMGAHNAVNRRVTHIHVRGRHIDFGAQRLRAVREFPGAHVLEQL